MRSIPRRGLLRTAALGIACAAACAAPKEIWRGPPAEVLVDVLPHIAELLVDGAPLGTGPHTVPVPDPAHVYVFRAAAPGFAPGERSASGARLAGTRLGLVLRPKGFGDARRLDLDDGAGLAAAAALLARTGHHLTALEYAERAVEVGPEVPLGHRVLGEAAQALGRRKRAIQEYSTYLQLAPDAPDRSVVQRRVEELRGDLTIPGADR
jgi:tetratricopeptide (TPR) repeat protein